MRSDPKDVPENNAQHGKGKNQVTESTSLSVGTIVGAKQSCRSGEDEPLYDSWMLVQRARRSHKTVTPQGNEGELRMRSGVLGNGSRFSALNVESAPTLHEGTSHVHVTVPPKEHTAQAHEARERRLGPYSGSGRKDDVHSGSEREEEVLRLDRELNSSNETVAGQDSNMKHLVETRQRLGLIENMGNHQGYTSDLNSDSFMVQEGVMEVEVDGEPEGGREINVDGTDEEDLPMAGKEDDNPFDPGVGAGTYATTHPPQVDQMEVAEMESRAEP